MIQIFTVFLVLVGYPDRLSPSFNEETVMGKISNMEIVELWKMGYSVQDTARRLNISLSSVRWHRRAAGIAYEPKVDTKEVVRLWESGVCVKDIASQFQITKHACYYHLRKLGIHLNRAITHNEVQEYIAKYRSGLNMYQIAWVMNREVNVVWRHLKRNGVEIRPATDNRKYTIRQNAFDDAEHNPTAAFWVGFLMADGGIDKEERRIRLTLAVKDQPHVEKFQKFLGTNYQIRVKSQRCRLPQGTEGIYSYATLDVHCQPLVQALTRYGVVARKSLTAEVKRLENDRNFWRGVIDGDGTIGFTKKHHIPTIGLVGSQTLMQQFVEFIEKKVGGKRPSINKHKTIWQVRICGVQAVELIRILYQNCTVALDRKQKLAEEAMQWVKMKRNGENHPMARLTEFQVLCIRDRLSRGHHVPYLAQEYGVTNAMIYRIRDRKAWTHI